MRCACHLVICADASKEMEALQQSLNAVVLQLLQNQVGLFLATKLTIGRGSCAKRTRRARWRFWDPEIDLVKELSMGPVALCDSVGSQAEQSSDAPGCTTFGGTICNRLMLWLVPGEENLLRQVLREPLS